MFDSLSLYCKLQQAGAPETQARAHTVALRVATANYHEGLPFDKERYIDTLWVGGIEFGQAKAIADVIETAFAFQS